MKAIGAFESAYTVTQHSSDAIGQSQRSIQPEKPKKITLENVKSIIEQYKPRIISSFIHSLKATSFGNNLRSLKAPLTTNSISESIQYDFKCKGIDKQIFVDFHLDEQPQKVKLKNIHSVAHQSMAGVERHYLNDGCSARARLVAKKAETSLGRSNVFRVSIKAPDASIFASSKYFQGVEWSYHIAAGFYGEDGSIYVMDPIVNSFDPVLLNRWIGHFEYEGNGLQIQLLSDTYNVNAIKQEYTAQFLEMDIGMLQENQRTIDFIEAHLLSEHYAQNDPYTKNHSPITHFAYTLGNDSSVDTKSVSLGYNITSLLDAFSKGFNAVDMSYSTYNDGKVSLFVEHVEDKILNLDISNLEKKFDQLGIKKLKVLSLPCCLTDTTTYKILE